MALRIGFVVLVGLLSGLWPPARARAAASLEVYEAYIACGDDCGATVPTPYGFFVTNPALVESRDVVTPEEPHEGHEDATVFHYRRYSDPVAVNASQVFSATDLPTGIGVPPPGYSHSAAAATGYAHTPCEDGDARRCRLRLGAFASAVPAGAQSNVYLGESSAEAFSRPSVEQRVFVRAGTSGLAAGTPVRLRLRLGVNGLVAAGGRSYPIRASSLSELRVEVEVRRETECRPDEGGVVCDEFAAGFDLHARADAFDLDPLRTPGRYGMALTDLRWSATSNVLEDELFDSASGELSVEAEDADFRDFLSFSTGSGPLTPLGPLGQPAIGDETGPARYRMPIQFLDFEARVGDTLDLRASSSAFAIVGGGQGNCCTTGGAWTDFFSSLDAAVEDAEGVGLEVAFDLPTAPADVTPPVTTATLSPAPNAAGWHRGDVVVTLGAADEPGGSGVEDLHYELAGAETDAQVVPGAGAAVGISAEGTTTLTYFARDGAGNQEAARTLTVHIDRTPPSIAGLPGAGCSLWPPDHRLVRVASVTAEDALSGLGTGGPTVSAASSEPADGLGDGDTAPDVVVEGTAVSVRAERAGGGPGRTYTIGASAEDVAGNVAVVTATCDVPHDRAR